MSSPIDIQYGLFKYYTENIGDEIQSIAARRFLPNVDTYIDRDDISIKGSTNISDNQIKLIMNGWFTHKPENWPPKLKQLDPLLISMYVDQKNKDVIKAFLSEESLNFLKKFGPVGARDKTTLKFLKQNNIPSYFSGCITLTLQRDQMLPRQDFILAVDTSRKLTARLEKLTNRKVIRISTYYDPNLSQEARSVLAEYFLYLYQSAYCVVTTRLHAALPSLAFQTPVLLIKHKTTYEEARFDGLAELVHSLWEKDFLKDSTMYDINKPPKNKSKYLRIRKEIEKKASNYTHYDRVESGYRTIDLGGIFNNPAFLEVFSKAMSSTFPKLLLEGDVSWLEKIRKTHEENEKHYKEIIAEKDEVIQKLIRQIPFYRKIANKALTHMQVYRTKSGRYKTRRTDA